MNRTARSTFKGTGWDEKTWEGLNAAEVKGRKVTSTIATNVFEGDFSGTSELRMVMSYAEDGSGRFLAYERFVGSLFGRAGAFVLEERGTWDGKEVKSEGVVVDASGGLAGLTGRVVFEAGHAEQYRWVLECELP